MRLGGGCLGTVCVASAGHPDAKAVNTILAPDANCEVCAGRAILFVNADLEAATQRTVWNKEAVADLHLMERVFENRAAVPVAATAAALRLLRQRHVGIDQRDTEAHIAISGSQIGTENEDRPRRTRRVGFNNRSVGGIGPKA